MLNKLSDALTWDRMVSVSWLILIFGATFLFGFYAYHFVTGSIPSRGVDFAAFWTAANFGQESVPWAAFDMIAYDERIRSFLDFDGILLWFYPPTTLFFFWPLGWLPYSLAILIYSALGWGLWALLIRRVLSDWTFEQTLPVIVAPAAMFCLNIGQIGLVVAICLVGFVYAIKSQRIWLAGLCAAVLLVKPHFGIVMPFVLLASGNWRVFATSALLCCLFAVISTFAFGLEYWQAFFKNQTVVKLLMDKGSLTPVHITIFALASVIGLGKSIAWALHILVACFALYVVVRAWREDDWNIRIASFLIASFMMSPYAFAYDMVATSLAVALLFPMAADRNDRIGKIILVMIWFMPAIKFYAFGFWFFPLNALALTGGIWVCYQYLNEIAPKTKPAPA